MIMINIYFYLNIISNCKHINYLKNSYIKRNNDFFLMLFQNSKVLNQNISKIESIKIFIFEYYIKISSNRFF